MITSVAKGRTFTVTDVEPLHEGQIIFDRLTVAEEVPEGWGPFYVMRNSVKAGDTITVEPKSERARSPYPGDRNKQGRTLQIPLPYQKITRNSDGKLINRKYS